jgi:hypothetical protein
MIQYSVTGTGSQLRVVRFAGPDGWHTQAHQRLPWQSPWLTAQEGDRLGLEARVATEGTDLMCEAHVTGLSEAPESFSGRTLRSGCSLVDRLVPLDEAIDTIIDG